MTDPNNAPRCHADEMHERRVNGDNMLNFFKSLFYGAGAFALFSVGAAIWA